MSAFHRREEAATYAFNLLDGFWSPNPYFGFLNTFKYEEERVVLDKYTIVEPDRTRQVCNWLRHFSPEDLQGEFRAAGFSVREIFADVAGNFYNPTAVEFAVVATGG